MASMWKRLTSIIRRRRCPECGKPTRREHCDICGYDVIAQARETAFRMR